MNFIILYFRSVYLFVLFIELIHTYGYEYEYEFI